jgi:hypothetical protein
VIQSDPADGIEWSKWYVVGIVVYNKSFMSHGSGFDVTHSKLTKMEMRETVELWFNLMLLMELSDGIDMCLA